MRQGRKKNASNTWKNKNKNKASEYERALKGTKMLKLAAPKTSQESCHLNLTAAAARLDSGQWRCAEFKRSKCKRTKKNKLKQKQNDGNLLCGKNLIEVTFSRQRQQQLRPTADQRPRWMRIRPVGSAMLVTAAAKSWGKRALATAEN